MGSFTELPLAKDLVVRYTVSVSCDPAKYRYGYYNVATFYLYSPVLKMKIGKSFRQSFVVTKQALRAAEGRRPAPARLTEVQLNKALSALFQRNANISRRQRKEHKDKAHNLNDDELFVFWLTNFRRIRSLDKSSYRTDEDFQSAFAKLCREIGSFDLSSLCTAHKKELESACSELRRRINAALRKDPEEKTSNTRDKTQIVRFAVECYLRNRGVDPTQVLNLLQRKSAPQKGIRARITNSMQLHCLPINRYREIFTQLSNDNTPYAAPLIFMIFLGLTAEEVCGLNCGDKQPITGYPKSYQIQIMREYREEKGYCELSASKNKLSYRCIPVPRKFLSIIKKSKDEDTTEKRPLLTDENGERLIPSVVNSHLDALLHVEPDILAYTDKGKEKKVDIAFQPKAYQISCRHYWHQYCGLTEGEICYLSAITPPDTASQYYIDYNNATVQYRMLKQLEFGLALFFNESHPSSEVLEWTPFSVKQTAFFGNLNTLVEAQIKIFSPTTISLTSRRGLHIVKGVE